MKTWSNTQTVVALSSGEAAYYGMVRGAAIALGVRCMLGDLGVDIRIRVRTDASAAKGVASRRGLGKIRHNIEVNQLWLQEKVTSGDIKVMKVKGEGNLADASTKALDGPGMIKHSRLTGQGWLEGRHAGLQAANVRPGEESDLVENGVAGELQGLDVLSTPWGYTEMGCRYQEAAQEASACAPCNSIKRCVLAVHRHAPAYLQAPSAVMPSWKKGPSEHVQKLIERYHTGHWPINPTEAKMLATAMNCNPGEWNGSLGEPRDPSSNSPFAMRHERWLDAALPAAPSGSPQRSPGSILPRHTSLMGSPHGGQTTPRGVNAGKFA